MNISNLTTAQLNQIIDLKEQIEALQSQLDSIVDSGGEIPIPSKLKGGKKKRHMSASARAKIAAAQKARWAKTKGTTSKPARAKRKLSAQHKRKLLIALAKARKIRWAKYQTAEATTKGAKRKIRKVKAETRAKLAAAAKARWAKVKAEGKTKL
jgi:trehalose/maltose hydrolase-like predicted phosphorylase